MSAGVIVSLVALGISIIVNLISIGVYIGQMKGFKEMVDFRFKQLEAKQDKYNNIQERTAKNESSTASAHHRIDALEGRLNVIGN